MVSEHNKLIMARFRARTTQEGKAHNEDENTSTPVGTGHSDGSPLARQCQGGGDVRITPEGFGTETGRLLARR